MFDGSLPEIADLASLTDAALVDAAGGWARAENAAGARKLAVMAEIFSRRTGLDAGERELWWIDPDAAVAAELAAALNVSAGMALHQTHRGVALRDRLPKVAALFEAGLVSDLLVRTIVSRTYLIDDDDAMAAVDAALAERVTRWGALSVKKTEDAIDALVDEHDPGALRRATRVGRTSETVRFGSPTDVAGTTTIWARLNSPDAALMEQNVEEVARSVCDADPRTASTNAAPTRWPPRSPRTAFDCTCGEPDCGGGTAGDAPAKNAVVYAVADEESVDAATAAHAEADAAPDPEPPRAAAKPAYVFGAGIMPTALLGGILERARIREVRHPGENSPPEPRYTPTRTTAEFVRCRDLTCRFPGCDKPAQVCDIDHTVAYPVGPTHPSNLKCLCRFHHLLKTFWNGLGAGATDNYPTAPSSGPARPGTPMSPTPAACTCSRSCVHPPPRCGPANHPTVEPTGDRGAMMPKRRHTRAHNTAKAKAAERRLNDPLVAERNKPPPF